MCASAASESSLEKPVVSVAQSLKVDRKPCGDALAGGICIRLRTAAKVMSDRVVPCLTPGKTRLSTRRSGRTSVRICSALSVSGTRCVLPAFVRVAGIVQDLSSRSISSQVAPRAIATGNAVPCPDTQPRGPSTRRVPGDPRRPAPVQLRSPWSSPFVAIRRALPASTGIRAHTLPWFRARRFAGRIRCRQLVRACRGHSACGAARAACLPDR